MKDTPLYDHMQEDDVGHLRGHTDAGVVLTRRQKAAVDGHLGT